MFPIAGFGPSPRLLPMQEPESLKRWSTKDPESSPGSLYDSEKPDSVGRSFLASGPYVGPGILAARSLRGELVVEADCTHIAVGRPSKARVIPWTEVARVQTNLTYPRQNQDPAIAVVLLDGEVVGLPDGLYPDAATDFPSRRHIERARRIATELDELRTAASLEADGK